MDVTKVLQGMNEKEKQFAFNYLYNSYSNNSEESNENNTENVDKENLDKEIKETKEVNKENIPLEEVKDNVLITNEQKVDISKKRGPKPGTRRRPTDTKTIRLCKEIGPDIYKDVTVGLMTQSQIVEKYKGRYEDKVINKYCIGKVLKMYREQVQINQSQS